MNWRNVRLIFLREVRDQLRDRRTLTLLDAIRKMSLMPARRLEQAAPAARHKGRVQEGADADLVVFDPREVQDQATYEKGPIPSTWFLHVFVAGSAVVSGGKVVSGEGYH